MSLSRSSCPRQRGLSLVELAVTLAVLGVLCSVALPSFSDQLLRQRSLGVSQTLGHQLRLARQDAMRLGVPVQVDFLQHAGAGSCQVSYIGAEGACTCHADGSTSCQDVNASVLQHAWQPAHARVTVRANTSGIRYEPLRGLATPTASIDVGPNGMAYARQIVALTGRVRSCTPPAQGGPCHG